MSSKFDIAKLDVTARFLLKSTFQTKADEHSMYPSLGRRIIDGSVKWGSNKLKIFGESKHIAGYWEWTEEVLARFGDILEASSINSAIHASLYSYDKHVPVMRAFFEGWCSITNTLHTREGELSISLWDLKMLGGLPIVGEIYDETVPHPNLLKGQNTRDDTSVPVTCKYLFAAYHRLVRKSTTPSKIPAKQWIEFWFKRGETYQPPVKRSKTKLRPRSTQNPSGRFDLRPYEWIEEEQAVFEKLGVTNNTHKEKLYLAAYISCWLCTFVLPENEDRWIRAGTFETACLMAEGRRFCLAAPALASIYRGLNDLVKSSNPGYSKSFFPAHYLYGWLAYYFNTHHDVKPEPRGPSMVKYSGAVSALKINDDDARALIRDGGKAKLHCFIPHKNKADILFDNGDLKSSKLSYLVSLRSMYLCLRMNDFFHIEEYNPSRFVRQFGFCQDVPEMLNRGSDKVTASRHEALKYWQLLLFSGSMSRVFLPCALISWNSHVTVAFRDWWKERNVDDLKENAPILFDSSKSKKVQTQPAVGGSALTCSQKTHPKDAADKRRNCLEIRRHSDVSVEVDPKHERRGKRKASALDADEVKLDDQIFDGVPSSSCLPSQQLEGNVALEMGALITEQGNMTRPLKVKVGKGKELGMLNQITPMDKSLKSTSQESKTGSSFVGASQGSIDGPEAVKFITPHIIESHKKTFGAIVYANAPTCSTVSFQPPTSYTDVFRQARQEIGSIFLNKLKNASHHEVAEIVESAHETYRSIQHLKGDVSSLHEQVDSYMSAVNAYLVVERFASECQRPDSLERDITMHQNEVGYNKLLLDKAMEEYQKQVTEHSVIQSKITDLETELSKARELESKLSKSLETKGEGLTALERNFENAIKSLKELENVPSMSADDEALLREQWARLEEMRVSLGVDP